MGGGGVYFIHWPLHALYNNLDYIFNSFDVSMRLSVNRRLGEYSSYTNFLQKISQVPTSAYSDQYTC